MDRGRRPVLALLGASTSSTGSESVSAQGLERSGPASAKTWLLRGGLALSLALLLGHAWVYVWLADDAFISFRYAQNLAVGQGLVFNPGERVEGYTNFLWVVLLAATSLLGVAPELAAAPLSLLATVGLWALVAWWAASSVRPQDSILWILAPCLLLAATRSVAVWSTGGLETRFFELLILAGLVLLASRLTDPDPRRSLVLPALAFALATLTRPDGVLIAGACAVVSVTILLWRRLLGMQVVRGAAVYVGIVGAHLLFRRLYYGDWVPNTWHAKVGGQDWSDYGLMYVEAFALEYTALLWIPGLIAGGVAHIRAGTAVVPGLILATVVPHAAYYTAIGGDHFEYRPFDLYFPLVFVLIGDGLRSLGQTLAGGILSGGYLTLLLVGTTAIPLQSRLDFPDEYHTGFPGGCGHDRDEYVAAVTFPLRTVPGVESMVKRYQDDVWALSKRFVALRQEEHASFLGTVEWEGKLLGDAVNRGVLRRDTYVAIDSVGAIPYYSGLRVLDRNGLTDRAVARSAPRRQLMAHAKSARRGDARRRGVELWATGPVHLVFRRGDRKLRRRLRRCREKERACAVAELDDSHLLVAELLQGFGETQARYPNLQFVHVADRLGLRRLGVRW